MNFLLEFQIFRENVKSHTQSILAREVTPSDLTELPHIDNQRGYAGNLWKAEKEIQFHFNITANNSNKHKCSSHPTGKEIGQLIPGHKKDNK
jgi:hypothetical protein